MLEDDLLVQELACMITEGVEVDDRSVALGINQSKKGPSEGLVVAGPRPDPDTVGRVEGENALPHQVEGSCITMPLQVDPCNPYVGTMVPLLDREGAFLECDDELGVVHGADSKPLSE